MNFVGKAFVIGIFIMSLVFMSVTMALYVGQRNWKEVVTLPSDQVTPGKELGLQHQLEAAKKKNAELVEEQGRLEKEYKTETIAKQQALSQLRVELEIVEKERQDIETIKTNLDKEKRLAVADMTATQANIADNRQKLDALQTKLIEAIQDRDAHLKKVVELTDLLNQEVNDKEQLRKRMVDLTKDLKKAAAAK
jgi:chromosome segregation ATPase